MTATEERQASLACAAKPCIRVLPKDYTQQGYSLHTVFWPAFGAQRLALRLWLMRQGQLHARSQAPQLLALLCMQTLGSMLGCGHV